MFANNILNIADQAGLNIPPLVGVPPPTNTFYLTFGNTVITLASLPLVLVPCFN